MNKIDIKPPHIQSLAEWVSEHQDKHFCVCGCGNPVKIRPQHRAKGIPRYMHGHHTMPMTHFVEECNKQGFYTVRQVSEMTGAGQTTIRRHEGQLFPRPAKHIRANKTRLFTKEQVEVIEGSGSLRLYFKGFSPTPHAPLSQIAKGAKGEPSGSTEKLPDGSSN